MNSDDWKLELSKFRTAEGKYYLSNDIEILRQKLLSDLEEFEEDNDEISLGAMLDLNVIINKRFGVDENE